jgi:LPPG:FO 2-phospho-L-lactate transferase
MNVVALSGGVGGARLLDGLQAVLPAGTLTAIVNTGDDLEHWGLAISPDLDTVLYTLAGLADEARGWGLAGDTFAALEMVRKLGCEAWFALGDRDLATNLMRTQALARGETLSAITGRLARSLGVRTKILPMCDAPCRTLIETTDGETLAFQEWLVRRRAPAVQRVRFSGCPDSAPGVLTAIEAADVVIIGPSNPYVSIDPILSLPGVRSALEQRTVVAVSPIVGGRAVKGPLAEMITALDGEAPSAAAVARHYGSLLSACVVETGDDLPPAMPRLATSTIMRDRADRARLAREVLSFAESLA